MEFSWAHLAFNLIAQLLVGLPLEISHGSLLIIFIYFLATLAGIFLVFITQF